MNGADIATIVIGCMAITFGCVLGTKGPDFIMGVWRRCRYGAHDRRIVGSYCEQDRERPICLNDLESQVPSRTSTFTATTAFISHMTYSISEEPSYTRDIPFHTVRPTPPEYLWPSLPVSS
ncbi:hypothetical protein EDC01DRAFT_647473 [Geopyxis carbonaria]|nr:hypothetical protein EDC01DRAFT_647473 [Geopyxis carbonaria]